MANIEFLNVDLDIESSDDLTPLLESFGDSVVVMNHDQGEVNKLSLELAGVAGDPNQLLLEFAKLIEALPVAAKSIWDNCSKKEIDIGFECEGETKGAPVGITERLSLESITFLSKLKITLAMTIYSVPG
ncbi:MAG: hypothetical protein K6L80_09825 [Agarilytica sp.]